MCSEDNSSRSPDSTLYCRGRVDGENRQEGGGGRTITHTCEALLRGTTYSERGLAEVGCIRNRILPYYIVDEKQYVTKSTRMT